MKGLEFLKKITNIDDILIDRIRKSPRKLSYFKWAAVAACLVLVFSAGFIGLYENGYGLPGVDQNLPKIFIDKNNISIFGGGGFDYTEPDISYFVNSNPWNKNVHITALPVYKNPLSLDTYGRIVGSDFETRKAFLLDIAGRLGMDRNNLQVIDVITAAVANDNEIKISVDTAMIATITFTTPLSLPETYHFKSDASYQDMTAAAAYLKKTYKDFIGMKRPQATVADRLFNPVEFYDKSGNIVNQIINYNFNHVVFYPQGKLFLARVFQPDLSQKVGNFPIISVDQAKKLLTDGNYISNVNYAAMKYQIMPGLQYIDKVELVYRTGENEKYFMPYYRFYIELPGIKNNNGTKAYAAYDVPAVEGKYISNMPKWGSSLK